MLNLNEPFNDAVDAFREAGESLRISPLASVVYMMQRDVINHYRYALKHYLTVDLSSPFLQNSSLGTPYQKWAKFTNEDFDTLFFSISNLLRYTARLLHNVVERPMTERHRSSKGVTANYIAWLVDIRLGKLFVGVRCEQANQLSIMPLPLTPPSPGTIFPAKLIAIENVSIRNEVLQRVQAHGEEELSSLIAIHEAYASLCKQYYSKHEIIRPFEELHESYYV